MPRSSRRLRISPGSIAVARSSVFDAGTCQNEGRPRRWRRRVASSARYQLVHRDGLEHLGEARGDARAGHLLQRVLERELAFDDVRVGVDDGMVELVS